VSSLILSLALSIFVIADSSTNLVPATNDKSKSEVLIIIPSHAVELADGVFSLGESMDVNGGVVEGLMFVYYSNHENKRKNAKPPWAGGGNDKGGNTIKTNCYSFMAKGAKWKNIENYMINTNNNAGLSDSFVRNNIASKINKWEDSADGSIDGNLINIFGNEISGVVDGADNLNPDGKNEILFADIDSPNVIGVTIVWGIFSGPPSQRVLVEWDQVYDDFDFSWSSSGEAGKMDFENIATHEIGHSFGLSHPPEECTEETMYAYSSNGETKKRTLEAGDIEGISNLY